MFALKTLIRWVNMLTHPRSIPRTSSENCSECARRWQASGYDPAVRCPAHRLNYREQPE